MFALLFSITIEAKEIEEVVVVGAYVAEDIAEPTEDNILETIQPTKTFMLGGFNGIQLSGTDTKHTGVFKNGVPVNDPSSGWYDFGHDLSTGQKVTVITGANSVRFGSGSMAGVVLLEDNFGRSLFTQVAEDETKAMVEYDYFQIAYYKGTQGSVKSTNTENDWYENKTFKAGYDIFNVELIDYYYEYDTCYDSNFAVSDDCSVEGEKLNVSIDHDRFTLGYTNNKSTHNTGYDMESDRTYADITLVDMLGHELGISGQKETYGERERETYSAYYIWSNDNVSVGYRYEEDEHIVRLGLENDGLRFSVGNSYRLPNLYEQFGDSWVSANPDLLPEQGYGAEIGNDWVSLYYYEFSEGIDFDMNSYSYVNTGSYISKGIRFQNEISLDKGSLFVYSEFTDSDKLRVPDYRTKVSYKYAGFNVEYLGEFDKGADFDGREIDDVNTFNISFSWYPGFATEIKVEVEDLLDNKYEFIPDYNSGGRRLKLSFNTIL